MIHISCQSHHPQHDYPHNIWQLIQIITQFSYHPVRSSHTISWAAYSQASSASVTVSIWNTKCHDHNNKTSKLCLSVFRHETKTEWQQELTEFYLPLVFSLIRFRFLLILSNY